MRLRVFDASVGRGGGLAGSGALGDRAPVFPDRSDSVVHRFVVERTSFDRGARFDDVVESRVVHRVECHECVGGGEPEAERCVREGLRVRDLRVVGSRLDPYRGYVVEFHRDIAADKRYRRKRVRTFHQPAGSSVRNHSV